MAIGRNTMSAAWTRSRAVSCPAVIAACNCIMLFSTNGKFVPALALSLKEDAIRKANDVDGEIKRDRMRPLTGIPYGAKDLLAVKGHPTTWGAKPYAAQMFDENAVVINKLDKAGAIPAKTVAFFSPRASSAVREMAEPALSISRFALDDLLAKEFRRLGGELRENERWRGAEFSEGTLRATGRRIQPVVNGWRWFGRRVSNC